MKREVLQLYIESRIYPGFTSEIHTRSTDPSKKSNTCNHQKKKKKKTFSCRQKKPKQPFLKPLINSNRCKKPIEKDANCSPNSLIMNLNATAHIIKTQVCMETRIDYVFSVYLFA